MSEHRRMYDLLEEYRRAKDSVSLPVKVRLYFTTLEEMLQKQHALDPNRQHIIDPAFSSVFQKLTEFERASFLHWMMIRVAPHFGPIKSGGSLQGGEGAIGTVETSCKVQGFSFGIATWSKARFRLDKFARSVNVVSKQRNILLTLEEFLLRRSRRHKHTLVLEAVSRRVPPENAKVALYFPESLFRQIEKQVAQCVMEAHKNRVLHLEGLQDQGPKPDKCLVFLGSEEITSFLKYKGLVLERLAQDALHFKIISGKESDPVRVSRSTKMAKIFKLQFSTQLPAKDLKTSVVEAFRTKFKFRVEQTVMEEFSKRYQAVYQKYLFSGQIYDQINLRQQGVSDRDQVYFSKGVDNALTPNIVQFVLIRVLPTASGSLCRVFASLSVGKEVPDHLPISFMLQFQQMTERGHQEQLALQQTQQEQFFSIVSSDPRQQDLSIQLGPEPYDFPTKAAQYLKEEAQCEKKLCRIPTMPLMLSGGELEKLRQKEHIMLREWKRGKEGGLVCADAEMMAQQKKMIKRFIASIGNSIFKIIRSGGFMNICMPVFLFKRESHLQSIARNFSYAPLFFDGWQQADPLERFKSCVSFAVSNCTLSISMMKPFNPILGETYQSWIGGCPLYMEQISHHPPVSSYYFQGRGYTLHGNIQAKISISGLNGGKCWSQKPTFIDFSDGTRVSLIFARMVIKNVIIGEREFHFYDKIFVYDQKHNYFAELHFGQRKKGGFLSTSSDPQDLIYGSIYRTTTAFLGKFNSKATGLYPAQEDIAKEICSIEGIWNESVRFDGKEYVDFRRFLPYEMIDEQHPLPSNSLYRLDLQHVVKGQLDIAQEHKQKLEQLQRHDRKLREAHSK